MANDLLVKEIETKDYRVTIKYDDCPDNPRTWDNLGHMVFWHNRYTLGDKHDFDAENFFYELAEELGIETQYYNEELEEWVNIEEEKVIELLNKKALIFEVGMTEHSMISLYLGTPRDKWDSGVLGYIYITFNELKKEYGAVSEDSINKAKSVIEAELEVYNDYVNGNAFWCLIEKVNKCECCGNVSYNLIDSCCGFYGYNFKENGILDLISENIDNKDIVKEIETEL